MKSEREKKSSGNKVTHTLHSFCIANFQLWREIGRLSCGFVASTPVIDSNNGRVKPAEIAVAIIYHNNEQQYGEWVYDVRVSV